MIYKLRLHIGLTIVDCSLLCLRLLVNTAHVQGFSSWLHMLNTYGTRLLIVISHHAMMLMLGSATAYPYINNHHRLGSLLIFEAHWGTLFIISTSTARSHINGDHVVEEWLLIFETSLIFVLSHFFYFFQRKILHDIF